jgi:hypothetical protein
MSTAPGTFEKYLTDRFVTRERYDAMPSDEQGTWLARYDAYVVSMPPGSILQQLFLTSLTSLIAYIILFTNLSLIYYAYTQYIQLTYCFYYMFYFLDRGSTGTGR